MNAIRKILAVAVMILAALGFLMCAAGLIGAWVVNGPATRAVTGAFDAVEAYAALANHSLQAVGENVGEVKAEVNEVNQRLANVTGEDRAQLAAAVRQKLDQTIVPKLERAGATAQAVGQTAVGVNQTLISINGIPGVTVPTFTNELQAIGDRLQDAKTAVADIRSTVAEANFDGSRALAATAKVSGGLDAVSDAVAKAQTGVTSISTAAASVKASAPGWINIASILATVLFVLFGAGQIFLFKAAWDWFRRT